MESAAIFGGSGFIGRHLSERLSEKGVRTTVLDIAEPEARCANVTYRRCDIRRPVAESIGYHDVAFNLAAVHRTPGHMPEEYFETNVTGALNVTEWATKVGVKQVLFTSSISVYGPTETAVDEQSPLRPQTAYGHSKLMSEEIHRRWRMESSDRRLVIVRPAVVFGKGEGGNFTRLAHALRNRLFVYPGRTDARKSCGYVRDLVRTMEFALDRPGQEYLYNFGFVEAPSIREVCETFCQVGGYRRPPELPRAAGVLTSRLPSSLGERVRKLLESTYVLPGQLMSDGFSWEYDLPGALADWWNETQGEFY